MNLEIKAIAFDEALDKSGVGPIRVDIGTWQRKLSFLRNALLRAGERGLKRRFEIIARLSSYDQL